MKQNNVCHVRVDSKPGAAGGVLGGGVVKAAFVLGWESGGVWPAVVCGPAWQCNFSCTPGNGSWLLAVLEMSSKSGAFTSAPEHDLHRLPLYEELLLLSLCSVLEGNFTGTSSDGAGGGE